MITGAHLLLYSSDADADRAFVRDVVGFRHVDAGHGWLIFALPPAELAVHPGDPAAPRPPGAMIGAELYLMCDDVERQVSELGARGVSCTPVARQRWGLTTTVPLPSGAALGLYQPLHPTAIAP